MISIAPMLRPARLPFGCSILALSAMTKNADRTLLRHVGGKATAIGINMQNQGHRDRAVLFWPDAA